MARQFEPVTELQLAAFYFTENRTGSVERLKAALGDIRQLQLQNRLPEAMYPLIKAARDALETQWGNAVAKREDVRRALMASAPPPAVSTPDLFSSAGVHLS